MEYMDVKTAEQSWGLTARRVTALCRDGRIEGAKKEHGLWLIPAAAQKPVDGRRNKSAAAVQTVLQKEEKLPLPIGVSDFKELVSGYYYADKTLMIRDFLDVRPKVSLFTRPRRFGKTLAMDMLKTFFEISETDTSHYFQDLQIFSCGEKYRNEQGKYPVIFLSFKDIKFSTWSLTLEAFRTAIAEEYRRHAVLLESSRCSIYEKKYFESVLDGTVSDVGLSGALRSLSAMLRSHYGQPAVIMIDEYDTPVQQGFAAGFYDDVIGFLRNLLSGAFKDNGNLAFGFMTGILRVAKESIFSGLNNITTHSIFDKKYSAYFGFTADEVKKMTEHYGCPEKYEELCAWYDGYRFGDREVFNPWSVLNYFYYGCETKAYWQSTGDNSIIRQIVSGADGETADDLRKLLQGQTVTSYADNSVIYPEIHGNPATVYSFLLAAGYLKVTRRDDSYNGAFICTIMIPNKEIQCVYENEILSALSDTVPQASAIAIQQAILKQNMPKLQEELQDFLIHAVSCFDYGQESFFHGLMLGLCAAVNNLYRVDSNRESGFGRYDIQLSPYDSASPGILIELKVLQEDVREEHLKERLERLAADALDQIEQKKYDTEMRKRGVTAFLKIGMAFYKKHVELVSRQTIV